MHPHSVVKRRSGNELLFFPVLAPHAHSCSAIRFDPNWLFPCISLDWAETENREARILRKHLFVMVFLIAGFGLLAACATRSLSGVSPVVPEARQQSLYFATQRSFDQTGNIFGESRFDERHYGIIYVAEGDNSEFGQFVTQPTETDWIARCERR